MHLSRIDITAIQKRTVPNFEEAMSHLSTCPLCQAEFEWQPLETIPTFFLKAVMNEPQKGTWEYDAPDGKKMKAVGTVDRITFYILDP
jgi:hypothetical protein